MRSTLRLLVGLIVVLGAAPASAMPAPASAAVGAETPVGSFNVVGEVLVGSPQHVSAGQGRAATEESAETAVATGVAANGETGLIRSRLSLRNERGSIGLPGGRGYRPAGGAADFDLDELAQFAHGHAGVDDLTRPGLSEIRRVLDRGVPTPLEGQNAFRLDYKGVRVIINEDMPWRSTAYYPGG